MGDYILLAVSCIFINNILLMQYLGNCPFLGVSKKMETAVGMAMAVVFVLVMAAAITAPISANFSFFMIVLPVQHAQTTPKGGSTLGNFP